jgi:hypothetical protein
MLRELIFLIIITILIRRIFYKKEKRTYVDYIAVIGVTVALYFFYIFFLMKYIH